MHLLIKKWAHIGFPETNSEIRVSIIPTTTPTYTSWARLASCGPRVEVTSTNWPGMGGSGGVRIARAGALFTTHNSRSLCPNMGACERTAFSCSLATERTERLGSRELYFAFRKVYQPEPLVLLQYCTWSHNLWKPRSFSYRIITL